MISHSVKFVSTYDLAEMACEYNNYTDKLPHPLTSEIEFISCNGPKVRLAVGQLAMVAAIFEKYSSPGKAIDTLFAGLTPEEIAEICINF